MCACVSVYVQLQFIFTSQSMHSCAISVLYCGGTVQNCHQSCNLTCKAHCITIISVPHLTLNESDASESIT